MEYGLKARSKLEDQERFYAILDAKNCKEEDVTDGIDFPFWYNAWQFNYQRDKIYGPELISIFKHAYIQHRVNLVKES